MNTFEEIYVKLFGWAKDRNIISNDNSAKQLIKLGEESGELFSAYLKQDRIKEIDSVGDILVVLSIYCHQRGLDINECFNLAWNEIKQRKGKTVDGTFIKDEPGTINHFEDNSQVTLSDLVLRSNIDKTWK